MLSPCDIPLTLYVHFPWCVKKCPYCDFNSHQLRGDIEESRYINALKRDLETHLDDLKGRELQSIFLGGGTPSLFSPEAIGELIHYVRGRVPSAPELEITLEANPGALEHGEFAACSEAGVNRLSLGVQSFNDEALLRLGRIHNADAARNAIQRAKSAGFANLNLDLMFRLPGQTLEQLISETEEAIAFDPGHVSFYQLTLEPNTLFHRYPPALPDDDTLMAMQETVEALLARAGFERYEVSAYGKSDYQCRHNLNYWTFGDYLGIGAGAHSKLSSASGVARIWKEKQPGAYMGRVESGSRYAHAHPVDHQSLRFEFMLNALRLKHGFDLGDFETRTGLPRESALSALDQSIDSGLVLVGGQRVVCSERGYLFIDEILQRLLP